MDWKLIARQLEELADGETLWLPALANASALLFEAMPNINWLGFYLSEDLVGGTDSTQLVLGPFQGKVACVRIPWGKGVCGTAAALDATQRVDDVHTFAGHIACDAASNSEVVVPLHAQGRVVGVLDVDSPLFSRFSADDQQGLEECARVLERLWRS